MTGTLTDTCADQACPRAARCSAHLEALGRGEFPLSQLKPTEMRMHLCATPGLERFKEAAVREGELPTHAVSVL